MSKGSQILYEKGNAPTADYLAAIAGAGADVLYILTGRRDPWIEDQQRRARLDQLTEAALDPAQLRSLKEQAGYGGVLRTAVAQFDREGRLDPLFEIDGEAYAALPFYDIELSAGPGVTNADEQVRERVAFRREWLRDHVDNPDQACLLKVRGDSMEPRLHDGDLVLIDRLRTEVRGGSIYAFVDSNGDTRVKRLDRPDRSVLVLRSDNADYPTELRRGSDLAALRIIGEVVWSGHTWR